MTKLTRGSTQLTEEPRREPDESHPDGMREGMVITYKASFSLEQEPPDNYSENDHEAALAKAVDEVIARNAQRQLEYNEELKGKPAPVYKFVEHDEFSDASNRSTQWGAPTDLGNAERLVALSGSKLRYCHQKRKWLVWADTHWQWDESGAVERMAKAMVRTLYQVACDEPDKDRKTRLFKWAISSESNSRIAAAITLAQSEPGISVAPTELDSDPMLFNVANGTIDLLTGELREHRKTDLCTRITNVEYDLGARSDLWDSFIRTATGGDLELATYLQRACGYAMQGTVSEKRFWLLFGVPDTSKSTFIAAIAKAFGGYHESADASTWLVQSSVGSNRGDMVKLLNARLVTSVEFPANARWDEALIKKVTGGDLLTYAAKYESEVTFAPTFALWCACNDAPKIRDDDAGMWTRAQRVPFDHAIPKAQQDKEMGKKLEAPDVLSAILAWCVNGCFDWRRAGLPECKAIDDSVRRYREENDQCAGFIADCLEFYPTYRCGTAELRDVYEKWCRENGIKQPLSAIDLAKRLREKGGEPNKSHGVRYWRGFRLATESAGRGSQGSGGGAYHQKTPIEQNYIGEFRETAPLFDPSVPGDETGYLAEDVS